MKKYILMFLAASIVHAADAPAPATPVLVTPPAPKKTSEYCLTFDKGMGFSRCETVEIVCYRFGKLEQCYPKAPQPPKPAAKAEEKK